MKDSLRFNKPLLLLVFLQTFFCFQVFGQSRPTTDWINFGSGHINQWLQIAPAKLGPNSLPVPMMDYARLDSVSNLELGVHTHFMNGDKAVNSYFSFYWAPVPERVVVQIWGFPTETFHTENFVRDERQIYYDDTGWITQNGDIWFSTSLQLIKGRKKFPDLVFGYSHKTTLGRADQGRFTDGGAENYYAAFGKSVYPKGKFLTEIRFGLMLGYYIWQTNKVEMAQDEGILFQTGVELKHHKWLWKNEFGGYNAYDAYRYIGVRGSNDPLIVRSNLLKQGKRLNYKAEYQFGLHDYHYNTFRLSVFYKFDAKIKI
jgi:hypothetical protein